MVQVIENLAEVTGIVRTAGGDDSVPGHTRLRIQLTGATNVGALPNLFGARLGDTIDLFVRDEAGAAGVTAGDTVAVQARVASPDRAFAVGALQMK